MNMHNIVTATEKIVSRLRPSPQACARPEPETVTTHAANCPECSREVRIGLGSEALVYNGCAHVLAVEQREAEVSVRFASHGNQ
jgi:hypothetical protein